jgi:hypothetical protein
MFKKIEFNLLYLNIKDLNIASFRKEIINIFNDNINYNFNINKIYYVYLLDSSKNNSYESNVITMVPFGLTSENDVEEYIEELFFQLSPSLQNFLKKHDYPHPI